MNFIVNFARGFFLDLIIMQPLGQHEMRLKSQIWEMGNVKENSPDAMKSTRIFATTRRVARIAISLQIPRRTGKF